MEEENYNRMMGTVKMVLGAGTVAFSQIYLDSSVYQTLVDLSGGVLIADGLGDMITGENNFFMNSLTKIVKSTFGRKR